MDLERLLDGMVPDGGRHESSRPDVPLPPLLAGDPPEEWRRRLRELRRLEGAQDDRDKARVVRLREECLDWIAAQDLDLGRSERLVAEVVRLWWPPKGIHTVMSRHFGHPRVARVQLLAAALELARHADKRQLEVLGSLFQEFEAAAPLDVQRACSVLDVSAALSRLGRREHRRFMLAVRPCLARAAEVIADQAAFDTREGMQQLDFALSFMLRHRHDAIAHHLLALIEARVDPAPVRSESLRIVRWSIALARCRPAGRALDREEFQRQLARAIEQLSPPLGAVQHWRLSCMRLRFLETYVRADAETLGLAELWGEYAALMPGHSPSSVWIDWRYRRRRRWRRRLRKDGDSSASDTSSTS